jgi:hypothetical protein
VLHNLDNARDLLARLGEGDPPSLARASVQRLDRLRGSLLQMSGPVVQELGLHKVLTSIVDDTAALCEAIHCRLSRPERRGPAARGAPHAQRGAGADRADGLIRPRQELRNAIQITCDMAT